MDWCLSIRVPKAKNESGLLDDLHLYSIIYLANKDQFADRYTKDSLFSYPMLSLDIHPQLLWLPRPRVLIADFHQHQ